MFVFAGFPTILFFSKGKVYKYEGRRTKDEIIQFVKTGHKIAKGEEVPKPIGWFGEFFYIFTKSIKGTVEDVKNGEYFTPNMIIALLPVMFLLTILIIACHTPAKIYEDPPKAAKKKD